MLRFASRSGQRWATCRRHLLLFAVVLSALGIAAGCESTTADRNQVIALVNQTRTENGLRPLRENPVLDMKADRWAQHLRDICALEHSTLSDGAPVEWIKLGENVGYGGTIDQIHDAYLRSPGHRANVLDPAFNSMGAAAIWGQCNGAPRVFTVHVFMKS